MVSAAGKINLIGKKSNVHLFQLQTLLSNRTAIVASQHIPISTRLDGQMSDTTKFVHTRRQPLCITRKVPLYSFRYVIPKTKTRSTLQNTSKPSCSEKNKILLYQSVIPIRSLSPHPIFVYESLHHKYC